MSPALRITIVFVLLVFMVGCDSSEYMTPKDIPAPPVPSVMKHGVHASAEKDSVNHNIGAVAGVKTVLTETNGTGWKIQSETPADNFRVVLVFSDGETREKSGIKEIKELLVWLDLAALVKGGVIGRVMGYMPKDMPLERALYASEEAYRQAKELYVQ